MDIRMNSLSLFIIFLSLGASLAFVNAQILPRIGPSSDPKPVSQVSVDMVRSLHEEMNCRWRTLGCASTDAPFAVTYLHMTRTVLQGIESQYFDDGDLMANFTLNFAGRYLDAIDSVRHCSQTSTEAWMEAFSYGDSKKSSVTEDTFLGMNAHINYDLPLIVEGLYHDGMKDNKDDYDRINDLLQDAAQDISNDITLYYDPLFSTLGNSLTTPIILQMLFTWRAEAWLYGSIMATASSQSERDFTHSLTVVNAVTRAQVFKTYNLIGLHKRTDAARIAYCSLRIPPIPTEGCPQREC